MKRPDPVLKLSTRSRKAIELLAGALALSSMDYQQQAHFRRQAEQVIESLRQMGGSRR